MGGTRYLLGLIGSGIQASKSPALHEREGEAHDQKMQQSEEKHAMAKESHKAELAESKKLTDADYEERDWLEWQAGLYWSEDCGAYIPSDNIERCIQLGAQKSRIGKDVAAAVFCSESAIKLQYDGPKDMRKLYDAGNFILRKGVAVQKSRLIRIRPMFPTGWKLQFQLEFDDNIINAKNLLKAVSDAGMLIGLGDWRPKFGRFICEQV